MSTSGFDPYSIPTPTDPFPPRLKKAEIIPTVIDTFTPSVSISIEWSNATAEYGNTINPSKVQEEPSLKLVDSPPSVRSSMQYTVALTDPDAPSRDDPEWSEICHWIATFVPLTSSSDSDAGTLGHLKEIMPYKPPGPPPKTGKHRYVFVALAPKNGTTDKLHLSEPADRQHWGYDKERQGVRMWAESNGLEVVGKFCFLIPGCSLDGFEFRPLPLSRIG